MPSAADELQPLTTPPHRPPAPHGDEPEVLLTPHGPGGHPRGRGMRVVGPGRRERAYQERIAALEQSLDARSRALEEAALVERGTGRLLDRVEAELAEAREREAEARRQLHRTLVLLGSVQREAEGLRHALTAPARRALPHGVTERSGWLGRLLARARRSDRERTPGRASRIHP